MSELIIGPHDNITSEIQTSNDVIILGSFTGKLYSEGSLFIEISGHFEGEAHVRTANIKGSAKGFLEAKKHVILGSQAKFHGVLDSPQLVTALGTELIADVRVRPR